jgi:O-antigen/teichoic acid export membrane protein
MSIYQQILAQSGKYSIGVIAGKLTALLLLPVYSRCLSPADYGALALLDLTLYFLGALFGMQLGEAMFYFYARGESDAERQSAVSTALAASVGIGVLVGAAGWVAATEISRFVLGSERFAACFRLQFISLALGLPAEAGYCGIRALDRPMDYVRVSILQLLCSMAAGILLLTVFHMGLIGVLWAGIVGPTVALCAQAFVLSRWVRQWPKPAFLSRMVRYAWPLGLSGVLMLLIHFGDTFVLRRYVPLADVGIYSLAYRIGMLVAIVDMPYNRFWNAQMYQIVGGADGPAIYGRICTYRALVLSAVAVWLGFFTGPALAILVPPSYQGAARYAPWIALAYVLRSVGDHFRGSFYLEAKTSRQLPVIGFGAAVCVAGYLALIPRWGLWGAVVATNLCFAVMLVHGFRSAQRVRAFPYELRRLAQLVFWSVALVALHQLVQPSSFWAMVALGACGTLAFPAVLAASGFFKPEEIGKAKAMFELLRSRLVAIA